MVIRNKTLATASSTLSNKAIGVLHPLNSKVIGALQEARRLNKEDGVVLHHHSREDGVTHKAVRRLSREDGARLQALLLNGSKDHLNSKVDILLSSRADMVLRHNHHQAMTHAPWRREMLQETQMLSGPR